MKYPLLLLAAGLAGLPGAALAQSAPSQTVTVTGDVAKACMLGTPASATLNIGALTDASGRLLPALTGNTPAAQTTIASAWCNTPSTIALKASPLTMVSTPAYAQPQGFARAITYTANLTNWSEAVTNRPLTSDATVSVAAARAQAAQPSLGVVFSNLAPLVSGSENPNALIEAGPYSTSVQITLSASS